MLILTYVIACAVICGLLAHRKNRTVVGWSIMGILVGVLAIIVIALAKPLHDPKKEKQCDQCRTWIDAQANRCPHCQSAVAQAVAAK